MSAEAAGPAVGLAGALVLEEELPLFICAKALPLKVSDAVRDAERTSKTFVFIVAPREKVSSNSRFISTTPDARMSGTAFQAVRDKSPLKEPRRFTAALKRCQCRR